MPRELLQIEPLRATTGTWAMVGPDEAVGGHGVSTERPCNAFRNGVCSRGQREKFVRWWLGDQPPS